MTSGRDQQFNVTNLKPARPVIQVNQLIQGHSHIWPPGFTEKKTLGVGVGGDDPCWNAFQSPFHLTTLERFAFEFTLGFRSARPRPKSQKHAAPAHSSNASWVEAGPAWPRRSACWETEQSGQGRGLLAKPDRVPTISGRCAWMFMATVDTLGTVNGFEANIKCHGFLLGFWSTSILPGVLLKS